MKYMNNRFAHLLLASVVCLVTMSLCCSCESGGGDDGGEEAAITGDAGLRVINDSEDETTVYFDDVYIGSVGGEGTRDWSVPSGSHRIKFDNAERESESPIEDTHTYVAGQIWAYTVWWETQDPAIDLNPLD